MGAFLSNLYAVVVGVMTLIASFFAGVPQAHAPVQITPGSLTLPAPVFQTATTTPIASTTPSLSAAQVIAQAKPQKPPVPVVKPPTPTKVPALPTASKTPNPIPSISPDALNSQVRAVVVNVLCTVGGSTFNPISGSGVIVDSRGIVLTNAHVAQFFLLKNYPVPNNIQCVIRTGSPAQPRYTAELLYLSPSWISENASQITSSKPTGTGEHDYAFLRITGTTDPNGTLPAAFPSLGMNVDDAQPNESIYLASYPAGFLQGVTIATNLYLVSAYSTVSQVFVFDKADQWIDLFSIPGSVVSQSGSSGGAAVRASDGTLEGIIVTDTEGTTTASRDLRAVSIAHIDHSLRADGVGGIEALLSGDVAVTARTFGSSIAPGLTKQLTTAITKGQ